MSAPEELVLVTDFASLRAGDRVVCKPCNVCGGPHAHMVLVLLDGYLGTAWELVPVSRCYAGQRLLISARAVNERRVWRVVIPPTAETIDKVARPKTRERVK